MLELTDLLGIALLALAAWLWWDGQACKDIARRHGRFVCLGANVQFLDDTVVQIGFGLCRRRGTVRLKRRYSFEFTSDAEQRRRGEIQLCGHRIEKVAMEPHRVPDTDPWARNSSGTVVDIDSKRR
jgi:hypothetical protein